MNSQVVFIDQGHPDDNFYGIAEEYEGHDMSYMTLEEIGLTQFAVQLDKFIEEVGPVLGSAVLDVGNFNEMCMKLSELQRRERK